MTIILGNIFKEPKRRKVPLHSRSGIVPILRVKGRPESTHICLGIDRKYKEYTDFGGCLKRHENFFEAANREFYEETLKSFAGRLPQSKVAYYHENTCIIFQTYLFNTDEDLNLFIGQILTKFNVNKITSKNLEVSELTWFKLHMFKELLKKDSFSFYSRFYQFVTNVNITELL